MKTYYIRTFGCQMNDRDSERMAALLEGMGYEPSDDGENADVVLINTCSVREKPEHKVYSELGRYKDRKRANPGMALIVAGCVAQQEGKELLRRVPHLDIALGTRAVSKLPEMLEAVISKGERICAIEMNASIENGLFGAERPTPQSVTAYVVAMTGCSNACSYCVVPRLRGPAVSRPSNEIVSEVKSLAERGAREITLLGQNVNIYGYDLGKGDPDFPGLLRKISEIDGIERIRFVTSHPRDFSEKLIREISENRKVCEYLHLPAQAGSNKVLEMMKRGYERERYLDLIRRVRESIPSAAITSDFIVGFPGESEADFELTLDLVREVRYNNIYSFCYSPRPNTAAEKMEPETPGSESSRRLNALQKLQDAITESIMKTYEGTEREILIEGPSKTDPGRSTGRTRCNLPLHVAGIITPGKIVRVLVVRSLRHSLAGEVIP